MARPLDPSKVTNPLKSACGEAGVREIRFHDLRHTLAKSPAASGARYERSRRSLGHSDLKTTETYGHNAPAASEVDRANAAFHRRPSG
jgi:integrase